MRRWLIALIAIAVVSLACVPLALAAGHGKPPAKPHPGAAKVHVKFQCEAKVFSDTPAAGPLVVTVKSGTKTMRASLGTPEILVQVDPNAKLINATGDLSAALTLDQLKAGAKVHLGGTIDRVVPANPTTWIFTAAKVILQKLPAVQ